jgi:flagellar basal body L-ring protein FlgH
MKAARILIPAVLAACCCAAAAADTLWTPAFDGYLTSKSALVPGDIVYVQIDGATSLTFQAASSDAKSLTLEFSGGEFGSLFSFLPQARTGGELSTRGRQQYSLQSRFAARVTQVDQAGKARIQGARSVTLGGKLESVALSGWLDPADLRAGREVRFTQLADSRLSFRTMLEPATPTLSSRDIERIVTALAAPAPGGQGAAGAAPGQGAAPQAGAQGAAGMQPAAARTEYTLTEASKEELFLRYINRLIDIIFQP